MTTLPDPLRPKRSLILCTTPRSGSTLVCALIRADGTAGWPESWYRAEDRADYAAEWGLAPVKGAFDPADYLAGALRAGSSANGVFALRLQPPSLRPFLDDLARIHGPAPSDRALIEAALGPCDFLHIRRQDDVAQAISRLKAESSRVWHLDGSEEEHPPGGPGPDATYDAEKIDLWRREAAMGNAAWEDWFAAQAIRPLRMVYEDYAADAPAAVARLLAGLGLGSGRAQSVPNRRMSDRTSAEWAARYRAERGIG